MADLQDLLPEERIKKLKKEEKEKQKEIDEARKKIKESEDELTEKRKWQDKVPMPEFMAESLDGLSRDVQDIIKVQKGIVTKEKLEEDGSEKDLKEKKENSEDKGNLSLEEALSRENINPNINFGVTYGPPGANLPGGLNQQSANLTYSPLNELQDQAKSAYDSIQNKGYMNQEEQKQMININSAIDDKFKAYDAGKYSLSEEAANAAMITKKITGRLLDDNYQSNKGHDTSQKDWYQ